MSLQQEQRLYETLEMVFENIECFLVQKSQQMIIYAFLQIKKAARKCVSQSGRSVERKSIGAVSQKNYSQRKKSISGNSARKSIGKQSHASFDIIKGAQYFNESRKNRPHYQKQYTEASRSKHNYISQQNEQPTRFTSPYIQRVESSSRNGTNIVPKLVGLVSSDELSDIQRPSLNQRRVENKRMTNQYERSIIQVDDDDDEFEDVVLNRLDKIEEKVNQMLREKRQQRLQATNQRPPITPNNQYSAKQRLANVLSGPNIIYSNNLRGQRNSEFFQYSNQPRYNMSSGQIQQPNRVYATNTRTTSQAVLNNPRNYANVNLKPHMTQRVLTPSKIITPKANYMTDHEQYYERPSLSRNRNIKQVETVIVYQQNISDSQQQNVLQKNKRLGHYRQSSGTLIDRQSVIDNLQRPSYGRGEKRVIQKTIDYSRMGDQAMIDGEHIYKYIPMQRYQPQYQEQNYPDQSGRHVITRIQREGERRHRVGDVVFIERPVREIVRNKRQDSGSQYLQRAGQVKDDMHYKSGRDSGIRERSFQANQLKAYTDQGDFIPSADDFSVSSDNGIYSQIRQLREYTRLHGAVKEKRESFKNRNHEQTKERFMGQKAEQNNADDYWHQQKTERHKYTTPSQKHSQRSEDYADEVIVERGPTEQRVYRVIREVPPKRYVENRQQTRSIHLNVQSSNQPQYVQFVPAEQQVVYRQANHPPSFNSKQQVYVVREDPHVYEQVYEQVHEKQLSHNPSRGSDFRTVIVKDDNESQKKVSSKSINTFKSIPYHRNESRKSSIKDMLAQQTEGYEDV